MTTPEARAFWISSPGRGEIRREPLPACAPDQVLVQTLFSGVSRGTESLVFLGRVPPSEYERMRAPFQGGAFPAPVKYGYSAVGRVLEGPSHLVSRAVFCLHPHQTHFVVPAAAVHPLPGNVPPGRAVLAAYLETAINGLWDAALRIGDRVTVIGAGVLGCLVAWLAGRVPGCSVELVDLDPARLAIARTFGVAGAAPREAAAEADLVLHASGSPEGLELALRLAGQEATIVELSWYGTGLVTLPLGAAFHARRLTLRSSQVGTVAPAQRARWPAARRLGLALELLADPVLDALIDSEGSFEELPRTMQRLSERAGSARLHRVHYAAG